MTGFVVQGHKYAGSQTFEHIYSFYIGIISHVLD